MPFEGGLDLEDDPLVRRVDGVPVLGEGRPARLEEGVVMTLGVDPSRWLAEADFSEMAASGSDVIEEGSQPHRAWLLGARSAGSYAARVEVVP